jgi:hypothetical protein
MIRIISIIGFIFSFVKGWSQPGTEIYLFDLKVRKGQFIISNPVNITNHKGYDNQPFFHPDKPRLYYAAKDSSGSVNIFIYDYIQKQTSVFTNTLPRKYSPTVTPDKKYISCIMQYADGRQDLVKYPIGGGEPVALVDDLIVGYHAWADEHVVIVFALPQPFSLYAVDVNTRSKILVSDSIGRSVQRVPGERAVSFMKRTKYEWLIQKWNATTQQVLTITKCLPGEEHDFAWTPDGTIVISEGRRLYYYKPGKKTGWKEMLISGNFPDGNFSRIAVNSKGTKLALVVSE